MPSSATRFRPGQSGNPGGRPKVARRIRRAARKVSSEMLEVLIEVARNGEGPNGTGRAPAAAKVLAIAGVPMNSPEDIHQVVKRSIEAAEKAKTEDLEADLGPKVELN